MLSTASTTAPGKVVVSQPQWLFAQHHLWHGLDTLVVARSTIVRTTSDRYKPVRQVLENYHPKQIFTRVFKQPAMMFGEVEVAVHALHRTAGPHRELSGPESEALELSLLARWTVLDEILEGWSDE